MFLRILARFRVPGNWRLASDNGNQFLNTMCTVNSSWFGLVYQSVRLGSMLFEIFTFSSAFDKCRNLRVTLNVMKPMLLLIDSCSVIS